MTFDHGQYDIRALPESEKQISRECSVSQGRGSSSVKGHSLLTEQSLLSRTTQRVLTFISLSRHQEFSLLFLCL